MQNSKLMTGMYEFLVWLSASFAVAVVFASFFEWSLHRFVMHKPLWKFRYPFEAHALIHHHVFRADETYHLKEEKDKHLIPMAWWNGPVLVLIGTLPFAGLSLLIGQWGIATGAALAFGTYFGAYEYMHWCMHLPRTRVVERSGIFFRLNGHHLLHHRYMHKNFNVVFPLADFLLGTLLMRSPVRFKQATGPAVPNVQPIDAKHSVVGA
jgi:hypothetical protein